MLRTRCYETERSLFLQPIVEAIAPVVASASASTLRQMLGEHAAAAAGLLPEVAAILGPPPPGRGSMEMERRRAFEAVRAFLRGLAEHNPVLVFVDDLQYAGQSTIELTWAGSRGCAAAMRRPLALGRRAVELSEQHEHMLVAGGARAMLGDTLLLARGSDRSGRAVRAGPGRGAEVGAWRPTCCAARPRWPPRPAHPRILAEAAGWLEQAGHPGGRRLDAGLRGVPVAR